MKPFVNKPLHVGRPNIGDREAFLARVNEMLDRQWLSNNGPLVQEFEQRLAQIVGVRHAIATCNATVAIQLAIHALGLAGEVIVPSYTFIATAHALQWQGITPVFADISPHTHNIDPDLIESLITPRTAGIIGVHLWGRGCDTAAIQSIAQRHRLRVMYDASHAFGCTHQGRMIGSFGDCEVFSFHATKFIHCFEGGAVVTNDDELAKNIRLTRNFGFRGFDNVVCLGINGKMSEVSAAMGLTNLAEMHRFIAVNLENYHAYRNGLANCPGVSLLEFEAAERHNYQYVVLEIDAAEAGVTRDALVAALHEENVIARKYFWPGCHRMEPYRSDQPHAGRLLPHTDRVAERVIVLPTGTSATIEDVRRVCEIIAHTIHPPGSTLPSRREHHGLC
jgi:dTDP-4-amino-4,6-dideoxygalactose transaminase